MLREQIFDVGHEQGRAQGKSSQYEVRLARNRSEIIAAQRLRYEVFAGEMGARLSNKTPGLDEDMYDAYCEHLVVLDTATGEVIGTYRILGPEKAKHIGGYYTEDEFDLIRLRLLRENMVEVGRSCIHPAHRQGGVITLLWAGLARYMMEKRYDYLIGCASISMSDGGHMAASIYRGLAESHLSPIEYRVFPRNPLPLDKLDSEAAATVPPLVKGYLRLGAWVCGEPAWDPDFNTADLPVLLPMSRMNPRYARHFLK